MLTKAQTEGMTTLERLQAEVRDSLTSECCNQIRGFYDFTGYWTSRDEAIGKSKRCGRRGLDADRKQYLAELFGYMGLITTQDIAQWTRDEGKEHMRRFPYAGVGRYPEHYKMARRQAGATIGTTSVQKSYSILRRTRWHIGAVLNQLTREEVENHVAEVTDHELSSTFWKDGGANYSNAIFRLEICKGWLKGTGHEQVVINKLAEVADAWLEHQGIGESESTSSYADIVSAFRETIDEYESQIAEHREVIRRLEDAADECRKQTKGVDEEVKGMSLSRIVKLRNYVNEGRNGE